MENYWKGEIFYSHDKSNSCSALTDIIIQTGITCKKTPFMCATQLAGDLFLKKLKYFVSYIHPRGCEKM